MALYTGNYKDFEKFIGPRLRNVVQTTISKNYKKRLGNVKSVEQKKD